VTSFFFIALENIFPMLYQATYLDVICFFKHMTLTNILENIHDTFVTILQTFLQVANNFVQHVNIFQEPLNDSRSLILIRFDI
jgi:hypothetical protein